MIVGYDKRLKALSPSNQFQFHCPIFGSVTKISSCFQLDELVMRGRKPEARKGCQACMESNKCPIWHIKQRMKRNDIDCYHSIEPKIGQLENEILETIAPILIQATHMRQVEVPFEREKMVQANEDASNGVVRKFKAEKVANGKNKREKTAITASTVKSDALIDAASGGDMAAAITAGLVDA